MTTNWVQLILGIWLLVSPWLLGISGTFAMWSNIVIGLALILMNAWELWGKDTNLGTNN